MNFKYFFHYDSDIPKGLEVKNFSPTHLTWLTVTLILMVMAIFFYRKLDVAKRRKVLRFCAVSIVMLEVLRTIWAVSIGHYDIARMLPLHLCGIMIFIEFFAVFSNHRLFKEFTYCTGLPGAFMALVTPEPSGYPFLSFQYLQSICIHFLIALVPLLMVFGDGFRPNIKYLPKCFLLLSSFTVFNAVVNTFLGSNYMFICEAPAQTPIELFDIWVGHPWYVGVLLLVVLLFWTLLYLPWSMGTDARRFYHPSGSV